MHPCEALLLCRLLSPLIKKPLRPKVFVPGLGRRRMELGSLVPCPVTLFCIGSIVYVPRGIGPTFGASCIRRVIQTRAVT